jgi:Zn finger protein HypA/HybF involved in hydrogenase expression
MEILNGSIIFLCPECLKDFEFDLVGEHQLVACPLCGIEFITVKKGQTLLLESFEVNQNENSMAQAIMR